MSKPTTQDIIRSLARMWNTFDFSHVEKHLADDVVYESQFVFTPLEGKAAVAEYLKGKLETLRKACEEGSSIVTAEIGLHPHVPHEMIVLSQIRNGEADRLAVFPRIENHQLTRIDLCIAPSPADAILTGEVPH